MLYHKLLYEFLLGPTSYYSLRQSKLVSRFAFEEADWLGLVWDRLALASDWLRDSRALLSCIGQVIAHNSSVVASMSFHVQGEVVRPARINFKDKSTVIVFGVNSNFKPEMGWMKEKADLLNCRAHKWHLNGFWPEKKKLFKFKQRTI